MKKMVTQRLLSTALLSLILALAWFFPVMAAGQGFQCQPTPEDEMGPFYRPGAAYRNSVGTGYLLFGTVKSAMDCSPIAEAKLELWLTGPEGFYGDAWRATLQSADNGTYYFSSHAPPNFGSRRAHIHIRATAEGFVTLVTQHYVETNAGEALFDLVLIRASKE